ncbi:hypothetical protein MJH12_19535, partial [bacterium]|nr:hypothetical protein [bacterium]
VQVDASGKLIDKISVDIQSQMPGRLLIVVEDSKILYKKFYEMTGTTAQIELSELEQISGDFTIHAYLTRKIESGQSLLSFRSYGSLDIALSKKKHQILPKIHIADQTKSREKVKVLVSGLKLGDLVYLSAVDQGIYDMISEEFIDPFKAFKRLKKRSLELYDYWDDLDYILSDFKADTFGGDCASDQRRKRHLPPESLNKRVKSIYQWSGKMKADEQAQVEWTFDVGDFQGQIKVQNIAVNPSQIGGSFESIISVDPIYVKVSLPRYMVQGDRLKIPYRIFNQSDQKKDLQLAIQIDKKDLYIKDSKVIVEAKDQYKSEFILNSKLLDLESKDSVKMKIDLKSKTKERYNKEYSLPVLHSLRSKSHSSMFALSKSIKIDFPKEYYKHSNPKLIVSVQTDPRKILKKSMENLVAYPHGCAEQTSSKLLALSELYKISDLKEQKLLKSFIQAGIQKLFSMQNYQGQFTYWQSSHKVDLFSSIYASHIVLLLQNQSFKIPRSMKTKILKSLRKSLQSSKGFHALYIAWILKSFDQLSRSNYHVLYENNKDSQDILVQAFLYSLSSSFHEKKRKRKIARTMSQQMKDYKVVRSHSEGFHSKTRNQAFALFLFLQAGGDQHRFKGYLDFLFNKLAKNELYSTQEKSFVMMLFADQMKSWPKSNRAPKVLIGQNIHDLEKEPNLEITIETQQIELI